METTEIVVFNIVTFKLLPSLTGKWKTKLWYVCPRDGILPTQQNKNMNNQYSQQSCHLEQMKPGIRDNVLCDIFVYNSRKRKLIYMTKRRPVVIWGRGRGRGLGEVHKATKKRWWGLDPFTLSTGVLVSRTIYICQNLSNYMLEVILFIICQLNVSEILKYMGWQFWLFLGETGHISARVPPLSD